MLASSTAVNTAWVPAGIATNYGGPADGKNPYDPSWGTVTVRCPRISSALLYADMLTDVQHLRQFTEGLSAWRADRHASETADVEAGSVV